MTVARFETDRKGIGEFLRSAEVGRGCEAVARAEAARIVARTPVDTGETAASTRVEPAMFADRRGAWIIQEGVSVALEFGNERTPPQHHVSRGL